MGPCNEEGMLKRYPRGTARTPPIEELSARKIVVKMDMVQEGKSCGNVSGTNWTSVCLKLRDIAGLTNSLIDILV